jgi:hypothetical protein
MISEDSNDRDVGRFMAQILRGGDGNGPLASVLVRCLEEGTRSPGDPISAAAWPLLPTDPQYIERTKQGFPGLSGKKLQEFLELLHQAASDLAAHEAKQGNRLATLQRGVQFSCTALLSHAQVLASDGNLEARPPLLLVLESPKGSRLAIASEESLENFYSQFENWLAKRLAGRLEKHQPLTSSKSSGSGSGESLQLPSARKDAVRKFLGDLETQRGELARRELVDERMGHYEQAIAKHGRDEWVNVVAETLVRCYLSEYTSGGPREFLGGIGRKTGLIFPYFQGRSRDKRVRPSVAILEMLVRACTSAEHAVPLGIFLGRLWKRFGILVGTSTGSGTEDATLLASHGMRVSPNDLEENCNALVLQLEELGLARRYPDNVAYIGRYDV